MNTKKWFYDPETNELLEKTSHNWWVPYFKDLDLYVVFADNEEEARRIVDAKFKDRAVYPSERETELQARIDKALETIYRYGQIDGEHHKTWVIDQTVRTLTGEAYDKWIEEYYEGNNPDDYYEWDVGIAP